MKKSAKTLPSTLYVLEYFELKKVFYYERSSLRYGEYNWEKVRVVHPGCYERKLKYHFENRNKLIAFLKDWYPHYLEVYFHQNLNAALKQTSSVPQGVIVIKNGQICDEKLSYVLREKRKKHPNNKKRKKRYWCDCYHCTGMPVEIYRKILLKDEKKL